MANDENQDENDLIDDKPTKYSGIRGSDHLKEVKEEITTPSHTPKKANMSCIAPDSLGYSPNVYRGSVGNDYLKTIPPKFFQTPPTNNCAINNLKNTENVEDFLRGNSSNLEEESEGVTQDSKDEQIFEERLILGNNEIESGEKSEELKYDDNDIKLKEDQISMPLESQNSNIIINNFQNEVMNHIKNLTYQIEYTGNQKKYILLKSEEILNSHISREDQNKINRSRSINPISNAAAIIYAAIVSNEKLEKISGVKMGELIGVSKDVIPRLYRDYYKKFARKFEFDFRAAQLGDSRKILSLYFFELLNNTELDLLNLITHLENIKKSKIILHLREILIGKAKNLTEKEEQLVDHLKVREIKQYKEMGTYYSETFIKYFSDLYNIIKLMIISNKTHIIIGADFFCKPFVEFLKENDINLFMEDEVLRREAEGIFDYLKASKSANLFPARRERESSGETYWTQRTSSEQNYIVGSRIKLWAMAHLYQGIYFKNGISVCLDCFNEKKVTNISFPRLRAKSFHHEEEDLKEDEYNAENLAKQFYRDRGNPYFLPDLIEKMEKEFIELKCRCHHRLLHSDSFYDFKKLISWENIYCTDFPYKDIFDLPAEIIHVLITVCIDNFHKTSSNTEIEKKRLIEDIIISLKKRYFIDILFEGICPICGEFNTRDHLPLFDYNHLYKKTELTPEERRKRKKINELFFLPCSKIVREMEKKYNMGSFVCANEHMVIHESDSNEIFDDKTINNANFKDHKDTTENFMLNLIHNSKNKDLINDPLKLDGSKRRPLTKILMAIFEISEEKGMVTSKDLINKTGLTRSAIGYIFNAKREFLRNYGKLIIGRGHTPTSYYLNDEGIRVMCLIYYFRDYYRNLKPGR